MSKKDYICAVPFSALEIHDYKSFLCCPSWLTKHPPSGLSGIETWNHEDAKEIRDSILDGSYRYCDEGQCPYLAELKDRTTGRIRPLYHKNELPPELKRVIEQHKTTGKIPPPQTVQFSFDRSCNLECPSCRVKMFIADSKKIKEVQLTIDEITKKWSKFIKVLYITGSGDPFISVGFRNFLRTFDRKKYPKIENIHLHTNATRWNKEMWESMPHVHEFVKSCEISIDAGTKDTYENKTRINGDWDELIENLKFIATIPNLQNVKLSFVVQKYNYKEMTVFYETMKEIFKHKQTLKIFYGKINNWGTFSDEEFKEHEVDRKDHPEYNTFVEEFNKVFPNKYIFTNLQQHLIVKRPKSVLI